MNSDSFSFDWRMIDMKHIACIFFKPRPLNLFFHQFYFWFYNLILNFDFYLYPTKPSYSVNKIYSIFLAIAKFIEYRFCIKKL